MTGAPWLMNAVTAAMLVIAAYCVARLITARLWHRDTDHAVDAVHIAMGVAMAGMVVPRWDPLPARTWEVIFAVAAVWFAGLAIRDRRHIPHVLGSAAMLYMYAAASDAPSMAGMSMAGPSSGIPVVSAALALALLSYVWRTATQLAGALAPTGILDTLPAHDVAALTSTSFFPDVIAAPVHHGLTVVFLTAAGLAAIAALASLGRLPRRVGGGDGGGGRGGNTKPPASRWIRLAGGGRGADGGPCVAVTATRRRGP